MSDQMTNEKKLRDRIEKIAASTRLSPDPIDTSLDFGVSIKQEPEGQVKSKKAKVKKGKSHEV